MKLLSRNPQETIDFAEKLGRLLKAGDTVALIGDLGAGKTVFTKGIAKGLRIKNIRYVNSPSFVIVKEHKGAVPLYHIDVYRLQGAESKETIPYSEYFYGDGVTIVEWADTIKELLPQDYLRVEFFFEAKTRRVIKLSGIGDRFKKMVAKAYCGR